MSADKNPGRPQACDWLAAALTLTLLATDWFLARGENPVLHWLGITSLLLAVIFAFPPFFLLQKHGKIEEGKSFLYTTRVVDRGLYAIVRHPQYLGYSLLALGLGLRSQHPVALALAALAVTLYYVQTVREEHFCQQQLGPDYEEYLRRVPRFNFVAGIFRYVQTRLSAKK